MDRSESAGSEPKLVGRYRLGEVLGKGGMGRVWRATDELLNRTVAVKELTTERFPAEEDRQVLIRRTQTEAQAAARITHPNVVTVHDVLEYDGRPWIVMQFVDGGSLEDVLQESGTISVEEAARIGLKVLAALRAAHAAGVLHRDVKPANVLLAKDGQVLLTDFGIAAIEGGTSITRTGELVGSIDYLAPERARGGAPGPESDLWALGAMLFTAVQGASPFERPSPIDTLQAVVEDEVPFPDRAGALTQTVLALLEKEPAQRLGAEEADRLLRAVAEGGAADARLLLAAHRDTDPVGSPVVPSQDSRTMPVGKAPGSADGQDRATAPPHYAAVTSVSQVVRRVPPPSASDAPTGGGFGGGAERVPATGRPSRRGRLITAIVAAVVVLGAGATFAVTRGGGSADAAAVGPASPTAPVPTATGTPKRARSGVKPSPSSSVASPPAQPPAAVVTPSRTAKAGGDKGAGGKKHKPDPFAGVMVRNGTTGKCAAPAFATGQAGSPISQYTCGPAPLKANQVWSLQTVFKGRGPNGANLVRLRNNRTGFCMDLDGKGAAAKGTQPHESACTGTLDDNELWYVEKRPGGNLYWIRNYASNGLCLDVSGFAAQKTDVAEGDKLTLFTCGDNDDQGWELAKPGNG